MKTFEERKNAVLKLKPCVQGIECTTGCTHGYAEFLNKQEFSLSELEETLRLLKRNSEVTDDDADYVQFVFKLLNEMQLEGVDSELLEVISGVESFFDERYFENYECQQAQYLAKVELPAYRLTSIEIINLQSSNKKVSYHDFIAAVGFKELVDMDLCFFHKDPLDMTLDEFRYFLMYSIGDSKYAIYFRNEIEKKCPELSSVYCFVHEGVMLDSYQELEPLLERFGVRLSRIDYDSLRDQYSVLVK